MLAAHIYSGFTREEIALLTEDKVQSDGDQCPRARGHVAVTAADRQNVSVS